MIEWYVAYLALGAFVGFFAGLFGIGGGLVMVPVLTWLFEAQHLSSTQNIHLALGTSMSAIIYTAAASAHAHQRHGTVNLSIVRHMTPGLLLGTLLGALSASYISPLYLTIFFAVFVYLSAIQMLFEFKPKPSRKLPARFGMGVIAMGIGGISSLASIGGGVLSVPFMLMHNVPIKQAIGTSAALGLPIALGGTTGYVVTGLMLHTLPSGTLGFVYLPALLMLAAGSLFTASLGAQATQRLPLNILRKGFALLLLALATKMLLKALI